MTKEMVKGIMGILSLVLIVMIRAETKNPNPCEYMGCDGAISTCDNKECGDPFIFLAD